MKTTIYLLMLLTCSLVAHAQVPNIEWQTSFGSEKNDFLSVLKPTMDGGFIVGGHSEGTDVGDRTDTSRGYHDIWVLKLDHERNIEWQRAVGGDQDDAVFDIHQTSDSGYVLFAVSGSGISGDKTDPANGFWPVDMWIIKLSKTGAIEWQKTIGGDGWDGASYGVTTGAGFYGWNFPGTIKAVAQDDGFVIALPSSSSNSGDKTDTSKSKDIGLFSFILTDIWLVKINNSGTIQWQKTIGGDLADAPVSISAAPNGGFILGAYSTSNQAGDKTQPNRASYIVDENHLLSDIPISDYWVLKLDNSGNIEWQQTIGGDSGDILTCVRPLPQGGYIVGGMSNSLATGEKTSPSRGKYDMWLLKLNNNGQIEWQKTIGGNEEDYLIDICVTADGGFALAGGSLSDSSGEKSTPVKGFSDWWIIKLDQNGEIEWQKTIGGTNDPIPEIATVIYQTARGNLIIGGGSSASHSGDKTSVSQGDTDYWIVGLSCQVDTSVIVSGEFLTAVQTDASYQWIDCSTNTAISGATSKTFIPISSGDYKVLVNKKGCNDTSACYHVEVVGISDLANPKTELHLYPNPADGEFTISANAEIHHIRIYNILGSIVYEEQIDSRLPHTLHVHHFPAGFYSVLITVGDQTLIRKLEIIR